MAASTHWLASQTAMRMLEIGGNAFDAAAAAGFVLQVAEPHLNGPLGEVPIIFHDATSGKTRVICGQGTVPAAATIARFEALGVDQIPGTGLLAAAIPGAFDAWMLMLQDHGSLPLATVMEPAISYARDGVPIVPRLMKSITQLQGWFNRAWPENAAIYLRDGALPAEGSLLCNPALADMYQRILDEAAETSTDREKQIAAARQIWKTGFVAEAIDTFSRTTRHLDITGQENSGLMTGDDLAGWSATYEDPATGVFCGKTICKTQAWGQGPVLLQGLALAKAIGMSDIELDSARFYHALIEVMKLTYADRETFYGDPNFIDVPLSTLLSASYVEARARLISDRADLTWRPGTITGFGYQVDYDAAANMEIDKAALLAAGIGEPTSKSQASEAVAGIVNGDTCHINVVDKWGNMISATPSGGWMESSPIIPELGVCLGTRLQMMRLDPDAPDALVPGKRPRTTLTPTLVLNDDGSPYLACGTPGGDKQDQWQLAFLIRHLMYGQSLQQAIDAPGFGSSHWPNSFYPRQAEPGKMSIESRAGKDIIADLRARGHIVTVGDAWSEGWICASSIAPDGQLSAAASPRGVQAYAVGR
nr:gamma-glutamyltransferase [uncultured Roseovarius sp.]